jgi:hypothetical protein
MYYTLMKLCEYLPVRSDGVGVSLRFIYLYLPLRRTNDCTKAHNGLLGLSPCPTNNNFRERFLSWSVLTAVQRTG